MGWANFILSTHCERKTVSEVFLAIVGCNAAPLHKAGSAHRLRLSWLDVGLRRLGLVHHSLGKSRVRIKRLSLACHNLKFALIKKTSAFKPDF